MRRCADHYHAYITRVYALRLFASSNMGMSIPVQAYLIIVDISESIVNCSSAYLGNVIYHKSCCTFSLQRYVKYYYTDDSLIPRRAHESYAVPTKENGATRVAIALPYALNVLEHGKEFRNDQTSQPLND